MGMNGPLRSGETSRIGMRDSVTERDQVLATWLQEKQDKVMNNGTSAM
jgi:hypothetical protein